MTVLLQIIHTTFICALRDRILHAIIGVGALAFLAIPAFSLLSMRQVQELAITLSLSVVSVILLLLAIFLGSTSICRDIERRYTSSVLGLPIPRTTYVVGKLIGIAFFLLVVALVLGGMALMIIPLSSLNYPSSTPISWFVIISAILADCLKSILIAALAILFSSLSTSFFLPFFGSVMIYFVGSASQEVIEFVRGDYGAQISAFSRLAIETLYYLLPNLSVFDLKIQAIYGLALDIKTLFLIPTYFLVYTMFLLLVAVSIFRRREFL